MHTTLNRKIFRQPASKALMGLLFGTACLMAQPTLVLPPITTPVSATASASTTADINITLTSPTLTGYDVNNTTTYNGWCIDSLGNLTISNSYILYSTLSPSLPAGLNVTPAGLAVYNEINWILNHKAYAAGVTTADIQNAIWTIADPFFVSSGNSANTKSLVAAAQANSTFVPVAGQVVGVILYKDGILNTTSNNTQDLLIEVPLGGSIGDFVWNDSNHNGIQDASELTAGGINSVTVNLYSGSSANGTPIATTTTTTHNGAPGYYQFTNLLAGTYTVAVVSGTGTPLAGLSPTTTVANNPGNESDSSPYTVTLPTNNTVNETIDFGFYQPVVCTGVISGEVFNDIDNNGVLETTESGLAGSTVSITGPNGYASSAVTTSTGLYSFGSLCPGSYTITASTPSGYTPSAVPTSAFTATIPGGIAEVANPDSVTLATTITNQDFGFHSPCNGIIGTITFSDLNADGIFEQSTESLLNGVVLTLKDLSTGLTTTTTSGPQSGVNGIYWFTGLCPGSYTVSAATPAGYAPAPVVAPSGSLQTNVTAGTPYAFTLTPTNNALYYIDFGFTPPCTGSVSGTVWNDKNANGNLESGETDLSNVTLVLFNDLLSAPIGQTVSSNASTGLNYSFSGLCVGNYWIGVAAPSGYSFSPVTVSSSNPTGSYGNGMKFSIVDENSVVTPVNVGLYLPVGSISGTLWNDLNQDGNIQSGEPGIGGTTIYIFAPNPTAPTASTITSSNATGINFTFNNVPVGTYTVCVGADAFSNYSPVTESSSNPAGSYGNCGKVTVTPGATVTPVNIGQYNVVSAPVISCPSNTAKQGMPYSSTPAVSGGIAPYTFSISAGSLPAGLSINASTGLISGTPTGSGTSSFTVLVYDSRGNHSNSSCGASCSITVTPMSPVVLPCPTSSGTVGSPYSWTASPSGGWGPYTFQMLAGNLPSGLSWNPSTGTISGTPTGAGTVQLLIQAIDAYGHSGVCSNGAASCTITINVQQCQISGQATAAVTWFGFPVGTQPVCNQPVTLTGTDCYGNNVTKVVQTDNNGNYCHSGLNPGTYTVTAPQQCSFSSYSWFGTCTTPSYKVAPTSGQNLGGCNYQYK